MLSRRFAAALARRFGTLGRDTFRGPVFHDFGFALIKDTPFGHRGNAEMGTIEFRAPVFAEADLLRREL
jgi:hypothetical protein